jgi:hypothetical protein
VFDLDRPKVVKRYAHRFDQVPRRGGGANRQVELDADETWANRISRHAA